MLWDHCLIETTKDDLTDCYPFQSRIHERFKSRKSKICKWCMCCIYINTYIYFKTQLRGKVKESRHYKTEQKSSDIKKSIELNNLSN